MRVPLPESAYLPCACGTRQTTFCIGCHVLHKTRQSAQGKQASTMSRLSWAFFQVSFVKKHSANNFSENKKTNFKNSKKNLSIRGTPTNQPPARSDEVAQAGFEAASLPRHKKLTRVYTPSSFLHIY